MCLISDYHCPVCLSGRYAEIDANELSDFMHLSYGFIFSGFPIVSDDVSVVAECYYVYCIQCKHFWVFISLLDLASSVNRNFIL